MLYRIRKSRNFF